MGKNSDILATLGPWSYIGGVVLALLAGLIVPGQATVIAILGLLGILVGLLNVTDREVQLFLIAAIAFVVSAQSVVTVLQSLPEVGGMMGATQSMLSYMIFFTAPAAAIVSVKALYNLSRDR